ncbi:MAG: hypothetical protein HWN81_14985 [Candidatus Lokiarchaeota archaeon]|nr:hypothetical protein [Candidatus Lokiarchaeota archaeon]
MPRIVKKGKITGLMIALLLLSSGCARTVGIIDYCLNSDLIRLTGEEIDYLSSGSLRQIDNHNEEYKINCL